MEEKITLIGTVNNNRNFLPESFLKSKNREVLSTRFLFQDFRTICSYVPRKNKSVNLNSTHHHSPEIEYDMVSNKPTIINHYNQNKAGVDTLDQIMETNSVRRKTHRWTLNMFFFILDSASQNAASLTLVQKSKENLRIHDKFRFRQNELEKLVVSLISPNA